MINGIAVNLKNISFLGHQPSLKGILMPEHLLSVCYGLGIDYLQVEIDGNEFPFFDGSGQRYLTLLKKAGIKKQDKPKDSLHTKNPLIEFCGESFIALLPDAGLAINLSFSLPQLNFSSSFSLPHLTPTIYEREIAWARTFGRYPTPAFLRKIGISYQKKGGILYPKRLRSADEFIRHKILDLLGDLKTFGRYLRGKIFAHNPSHKLTHQLLLRISANEAVRNARVKNGNQ